MRETSGVRAGTPAQIYFDIDGRELNATGLRKDHHRKGFKGRGYKKCYTLVYPVTFIAEDRTIIIVENEGGWQQLRDWHAANPEAATKPALQFPVDIILSDESTTVTIDSEEEIDMIHKDCYGERRKRGKCFEFVYPITFILPDGSTITVEEAKDKQQIRDWYEANPDVTEKPAIRFPIDITLSDGTTTTIDNEEEFDAIRKDCHENRPGRGKRCFEFVYPITFVVEDGSTITIDDKNNWQALKDWIKG